MNIQRLKTAAGAAIRFHLALSLSRSSFCSSCSIRQAGFRSHNGEHHCAGSSSESHPGERQGQPILAERSGPLQPCSRGRRQGGRCCGARESARNHRRQRQLAFVLLVSSQPRGRHGRRSRPSSRTAGPVHRPAPSSFLRAMHRPGWAHHPRGRLLYHSTRVDLHRQRRYGGPLE